MRPSALPKPPAQGVVGVVVRLLAVLLLAGTSGCGLRAGGPVEAVRVTSLPSQPGETRPPAGWREVSVYFVRGDDLSAVARRVADPGPHASMSLLLAGPTRSEVLSGIRTALSRQDLVVSSGPDDTGILTIAVSRDLAGIAGANQLLAVAQVVWTVTEFPAVDRVRLVLNGSPLQLPTDAGLTDRPVGRADLTSMAPRPAATGPTVATSPPAMPSPTG